MNTHTRLPMKTACIGEIIYDRFPNEDRLGGAPCNVAVMLSQLGCQSTIISAIAQDDLGIQALNQLRSFNLNLNLVQNVPQPTGQVNIILDNAGKPTYDFPNDSAYDHLEWTDALATAAPIFDAICFGTLAQRGPSAQTIRSFLGHTRPDALRILDLNLRAPFYDDHVIRESLKLANILKLNDEELPILAQTLSLSIDDTIPALLNDHIQLVALSLGAKGAKLYTQKQVSICPAASVKNIVDTVGAGDSYTAALITGLLQGLPLESINQQANRIAAFVCGSSGATPNLPAELNFLLP